MSSNLLKKLVLFGIFISFNNCKEIDNKNMKRSHAEMKNNNINVIPEPPAKRRRVNRDIQNEKNSEHQDIKEEIKKKVESLKKCHSEFTHSNLKDKDQANKLINSFNKALDEKELNKDQILKNSLKTWHKIIEEKFASYIEIRKQLTKNTNEIGGCAMQISRIKLDIDIVQNLLQRFEIDLNNQNYNYENMSLRKKNIEEKLNKIYIDIIEVKEKLQRLKTQLFIQQIDAERNRFNKMFNLYSGINSNNFSLPNTIFNIFDIIRSEEVSDILFYQICKITLKEDDLEKLSDKWNRLYFKINTLVLEINN